MFRAFRDWWQQGSSPSRRGRKGDRPRTPACKPDLEVLEGRVLLANHIWTGGSGIDSNWSRGTNWDTGVPGVGDTAVFNRNSPSAIVDAAFTGTIDSLNIAPNWNGTLTVNRNLTLTGSSTWASGTINGGTAGLTNSGTLTVTGAANKYLSGLLTNSNNGTIVQAAGPGSLGLHSDAQLVNAGIYDFRADSTGIFLNDGDTSVFTNTGTVRKSAGSSTNRSFLHVSIFNNNGGSFDVQTGRLALGQARVSSTGSTISVAAGAVLDLTDNTTTTYSGTFGNGSGGGNVRILNSTLGVQALVCRAKWI
jgi:hypothetical protein